MSHSSAIANLFIDTSNNLNKIVFESKRSAIEGLIAHLGPLLTNEDPAMIETVMNAIQNFYDDITNPSGFFDHARIDRSYASLPAADSAAAAAGETNEANEDAGGAAGAAGADAGNDTKKKTKKKRMPNAYNVFMSEKMKELKSEHPEMSNADILSISTKAYKEDKALDDKRVAERTVAKKRKIAAEAKAAAAGGGE